MKGAVSLLGMLTWLWSIPTVPRALVNLGAFWGTKRHQEASFVPEATALRCKARN